MSQFRMPKPPDPTPEELARVCGKTSGMAVASLVLGLVGFLTCGLTGLIGLILGIVALPAISKSAGMLRGTGLAVSGIVVSALSLPTLFVYGIVAAIVMPQFADASRDAMEANARSQVMTIRSQIELYNAMKPDVPYDANTPLDDFWGPLVREKFLLDTPRNPLQGGSTVVARSPAMNVGWVWAALDPTGPGCNFYAVSITGDDVLSDDPAYAAGSPW